MNFDFDYLKLATLPDSSAIWTLEFDHGKKANEVGSAVLAELEKLSAMLEGPDGPVGLISFSRRVSSRGTPIFISAQMLPSESIGMTAKVRAHVRYQRGVLSRLRRAPVFHVCLVDGVALGWGTEFLITADYKIASSRASFGLPEQDSVFYRRWRHLRITGINRGSPYAKTRNDG